MRVLEYKLPAAFDGKPLLHFLKGGLGFSTHIVQSIRHTEGALTVNGNFARVVDKAHENDTVKIMIPEKTTAPLLWKKELDIVYEDNDILILNKPAGIAVHPSHNHPNGTLANAVSYHLKNTEGEESAARAVGRLDKGTSGLIVFAKNALSASKLNGKIEKIYIALASNILPQEGTVTAPIIRPDPMKTLRDVGEGGEKAITHYKVLGCYGNCSLLKVQIDTGRTHQIRVHCKSLGAPLLGDDMYGAPFGKFLNRPALHCSEITFIHPTENRTMYFTIDLPEDMRNELKYLKHRVGGGD